MRRVNTRIKVVKVRITDKALKVIKDEAQALDMKSLGVFSRICEWFAAQDDVTRRGVLGLLPESMRDEVVEMALKSLKKGKK